MSIRIKTIIAILGTFIVTALCLFAVARSILIERFLEIELVKNRQDLDRAKSTFDDIFLQIKKNSADWGYWTEAYDFAQDGNATFRENNLLPEGVADANVNLIAFLKEDRSLWPEGSFASYDDNPDAHKNFNPVEFINRHVRNIEFNQGDELKDGLILYNNYLIYIVARKLRRSDHSGPPSGVLVFAKFIDDDLISSRQDIIKRTIKTSVIEDGKVKNRNFSDIYQDLVYSSEKKILVTINSKLQNGYFLYEDISDNPVFIVEVSLDRSVYESGLVTIRVLLFSFVIVVVVSSVLFLILIEKVVIFRLSRLTKKVRDLKYLPGEMQVIRVRGNDEIRILADTINRIFGELHAQSLQIKAILSNVPHGICLINKDGIVCGETSSYFQSMFPDYTKDYYDIIFNIFAKSNLGLQKSESLRSNITEIFECDYTIVNEKLKNFPISMTININKKNYMYECDWAPIIDKIDEKTKFLLVTFRDVTKLNELQEQLNTEMRLNLAATVAHNLNNPLNYIKLGSDGAYATSQTLRTEFNNIFSSSGSDEDEETALVKQHFDKIFTEFDEPMNLIWQGVDRATTLVKELRVLSGIDRTNIEELDTKYVWTECLKRLKESFDKETLSRIVFQKGDLSSHKLLGNSTILRYSLERIITLAIQNGESLLFIDETIYENNEWIIK